MASSVRRKLELGDRFAANSEYHSASYQYDGAYLEILTNLGEAAKLDTERRRPGGIQALLMDANGSSVSVEKYAAFGRLRDEHARVHGVNLSEYEYVQFYHCVSVDQWLVVYHHFDHRDYGGLKLKMPTGTSQSFVMTIHHDGATSVALSKSKAALLSYTMAHLGWSKLQSTIGLYTEKQILTDLALPAIQQDSRLFRCSLCLNPENTWAWAHYGEVYRLIGNGWPGSVAKLGQPIWRVEQYIKAIVYLHHATKLDPEEFWAHAHLGAALVNVRGFAGTNDDIASLIAAIQQLCPDVPKSKLDVAWMDYAAKSLGTAQELVGYYYPWAELYQADAFAIKAVLELSTQSSNATELGVLSLVQTLDGLCLQPQLAANLFEPGELYVNPFFQFGLLAYWAKHLSFAWSCTRLGMARLFKFNFMPGVQGLMGYELLANIAQQWIGANMQRAPAPVSIGVDLSDAPVPIGKTPIDNPEALVGFIEQILERVCKPAVNPYLGADIKVNTIIAISLVQVSFVLDNFAGILDQLNTPGASAVRDEIQKFGEVVLQKSGLYKDVARTESLPEGVHLHSMLSSFVAGKPSFRMAGLLSHRG